MQPSRSEFCSLDRASLRRHQWDRLQVVWQRLKESEHPLYREALQIAPDLSDWETFQSLPFLTKSDLLGNSREEPSKLFTQPRQAYSRAHQTSGSRGWPMPIYDTPEDWRWWLECWQYVLDAGDVRPADTVMMAFSFGPFIGFWSANDALVERGCLVVPGGGLSSSARLQMMLDRECTVVCCTPTYALHLVSVANEHGIDLKGSSVSRLIVAGEPGGSVPEIRRAIEEPWGARVIDHAGASELGAWGFPSAEDRGLHVIESEFIAEFFVLDEDGQPGRVAESGEASELVMTNLGRHGGPAIRYRTGDIVRPVWEHGLPCQFVKLDGGVIGRADDMLVIRGVNVFPASIEAIVRQVVPEAEFRMIATRQDHLDQLSIEIESPDSNESQPGSLGQMRELRDAFRERLALRVEITLVPAGSLPRSEGKSKRFVDRR
ncbi:Phenylacetate-coenzyme A ligase [Rhodopirellula islandica]|uniref:Phenylacetate-coenzyme A ligase n=1 Tax=Rhodopirellula islandica TaxID=595434 RepID=A0A0J1B7V3_RHOIS|nr:phenylacetate--CoA ligase [Rhodopirellula islandica]KLU02531.1 Phenylacetate-coenzyme A ligase [Rhodopirellula islandica]